MKWKLSLAQKIRTGAALVMVFLLVLATNLMDNNHFKTVQKSLISIYEDRLIAKAHLYKITRQLQLKKDVVKSTDRDQIIKVNSAANDSIQILIEKFNNTKITAEEAIHLRSLKSNLKKLSQYESKLPLSEKSIDEEFLSLDIINKYYYDIFANLDVLSAIQLKEGKAEVGYSNRAVESSNLISRFEIGALIVIGFLIQLLLFVKPLK